MFSLTLPHAQPSAESLKKVLDGKVALAEGKREEALPGGKDEGSFCISLSKLLSLDEASVVSFHTQGTSTTLCNLVWTTDGGRMTGQLSSRTFCLLC